MTADIIQFKRKKKPGDDKVPGKEQQAEIVRNKTNAEIYGDTVEDVTSEWKRAAVNNRLSEYIASKIPEYARGPKMTDYVGDLNALSVVESKLNMRVAVFSPGITPNSKIGWLASFHHGQEIFTTPSDMSSECMARAMNVVLCVSFQNVLKTLGRN